MDDCLAVMLGSTFAIFVTAGNFKAAFDLPDLTIVFGAASVLVAMLLVIRFRRIPRTVALALRWWFLISLLCLLSTLLNPLRGGWETKLARLIVVDGWCLLGGTLLATRTRAQQAFSLSFLLVGILVSLSFLLSVGHLGTSVARLKFTNYIDIARLAGLASLLCLSRLSCARGGLALVAYGIGTSVLGGVTLAAGSRGPSLALLMAFSLWGILSIKVGARFRHKGRMIALFLLLVLLLWGASARGFFAVTLDRWSLFVEGRSTSRLDLLGAGVELWLQSPLLGNGANSFPAYYGSSDPDNTPHNLIVELAAEFGLAPALAALFCTALLFYRCVALCNRMSRSSEAASVHLFCALGLAFWVAQYPLMGISSAKYLMALLGFAVTLSTPHRPGWQTTPKEPASPCSSPVAARRQVHWAGASTLDGTVGLGEQSGASTCPMLSHSSLYTRYLMFRARRAGLRIENQVELVSFGCI